ncbi:MAG: prepilin-type N-terminal cleavage/methylation domain-containing protein [Drouetiella hepatica Uher 2000/2452]|jgi:prepilin-type N-terminal cleavage/methylation domain-containing protein|uniref:Prepilin-type N-terminal cleavage/methylation domain-containing protein n=1 Tax=Drouetiella hepatica Uher 2000/2452 TaxID=904376 RepID=A0A951QGR5_9CYAN|nr:prepilin-type N-terminal cleavage/methylation domain-containing protein [Drouetiella hepatica Uher 2000/2452]
MIRKSSSGHSTFGYTLIEMMTVLVIVGVLSAIAAPGWLSFMNSRRANAARDQVSQVLRQAQAQALRTKQSQTVAFNVTAAPPTITALGVTDPIGNGQLEPNSVTLQAKNGATNISTLEFDTNGNLKNPALDQQGLKITVTVPPNTGAKRCVIVQTLLGAMRSASGTDCN